MISRMKSRPASTAVASASVMLPESHSRLPRPICQIRGHAPRRRAVKPLIPYLTSVLHDPVDSPLMRRRLHWIYVLQSRPADALAESGARREIHPTCPSP